MIAITTYTDPFVTAAVSEVPQPLYDPIESREDQESADFEEILAGILQNRVQPSEISSETSAEVSETENVVEEISVDNLISSVNFDIHTLLDNSYVQDIEVEGEIDLSDIELSQVFDELPQIDLTSGDLLQEFTDVFSDAEQLFTHAIDTDQGVGIDEQNFLPDMNKQELVKTKNNETAAQIKTQAEFSASMIEGRETVQQVFTSPDAVKAQLDNENSIKDRANLKQSNIAFNETKTLSPENPAEKVLAARPDEKTGRLDEMRSRSRRDKVAFEVRDMRTSADTVNSTQARSHTTVEAAAARVTGNASGHELTLELRLPDYNGGQAGQSAQVSWEAKSGAAFESMLSRELHQNFNGDIVRHASVALRDGGESTIKLNLHPESLGNVKIRLEMTENKITGHIIVESKEALNAFREQIAELEQAFRDSGFADASLNLSLSADGSGAQQHNADILPPQQVALIYEDSLRDSTEIETVQVDVYFGRRQGKVNMLA